ncbi:hypothetical protein DFJ58DRAFT_225894 [Suillus subalutaceus]|uniref:uncharacterized protein n=1 Tax=Suillus subalutaceus TaxID=48586 RepID=UPI001B85E16E|nr:uncharacterized protein DFJ58DRAFT_225894 [Suillus subalutaceus]KAG1862767.1 hypothetical protein DFJ58DRAFT_225894 [Suillus subalutaceus]
MICEMECHCSMPPDGHNGRRTGHEVETNMLLPHGVVLQYGVNIHYFATKTTMDMSTCVLLSSEGSTAYTALVNAGLSPRLFLEVEAKERLLEWKKKWEEGERNRVSLEDKLKKLQVEAEQQISAPDKDTKIIWLMNTLKKASKEADEIQIRLLLEQSEREKVQQERSKLEDAVQKLQQDLSSYQQQLLMRESENRTMRNELQALQTKFNDQTVLLNDCTRKLQGAQGFLSKADTLAEQSRAYSGMSSPSVCNSREHHTVTYAMVNSKTYA